MRNKKLNFSKNDKNYYYLFGKHSVLSALQNPKRHIEDVLCTEDNYNVNKELIDLHPHKIVNNDYLSKVLEPSQIHQGIVAKVKSIFSNDINYVDLNKANCKVAILDQITDPQNIGAIIRSAAAFEVDALILPIDNSPDENGSLAKVASGALELIKIIKVTNLRNTMDYLKKHGFWIIGLDSSGSNYFSDKLLSNKVALVFGSEDKGIRRLVKETCDYLVKIPISNKVESLNVSNAASIIFHMSYAKHS